MLAHVLKSVVAQVPGIDPALIGDVIVGCAMPEAEQGMNVARIGVLLAGLPNTVPGITINRFCSSGCRRWPMLPTRSASAWPM
jgi:acetyl-CoA acyltransferase